MYIVNTTFVIQPLVHDMWYGFFVEKIIPQIKAQGYNICAFTRVLHEQSEGHYSYSLQVQARDITEVQKFQTEVIQEYAVLARKLYNDNVLHFTSVLKKIQL